MTKEEQRGRRHLQAWGKKGERGQWGVNNAALREKEKGGGEVKEKEEGENRAEAD